MGRQHRWLFVAQAVSFAFIAYSIIRFSTTVMWLLLFIVPITLYLIGLIVALASSMRTTRTGELDHDLRVAGYAPTRYPSIDVMLPTAGEPLDVLANTYKYVAEMKWEGHVRVLVLDDSARDEVQELARAHGFDYLVRPDRGHLKKAGNLKYGYDRSDGDFILIFDADFVPRHDFLANTIPYFEEENVGIVQTPQFFDAKKGMPWLQRTAGATQELFYRFIQPTRDRSNAAICVGSNAVYRRAALIRSGGFAQIGHSEDVHTGVNLLKIGFCLRYVPILVAKGLCPDTAGAFLNQQYRWATGSMSLLADPTFHDNEHIGIMQRLCFWAGFLYYISTALNAFVAPLPGIVMVCFLPQFVTPSNSIWLVGAISLWFAVFPLLMKGRWRVDVLRIQMMYSFAHAVAILHIMGGRTRGWVSTGQADSDARAGKSTPLGATIGRVMKFYVFITQSIIAVGLVRGVEVYGIENFWAMCVLGALSLYIHVPLLFVKTGAPKPSWASIVWVFGTPRRLALSIRNRRPVLDSLPVPPRSFRPDIQGLRAIAVLMVVLYHAKVPLFTGGYAGVDVFFVISGFLITGHLIRDANTGRISLTRFYIGRIRRLLIPATVVLIITVLVSRLWGSIFQVRAISTDAIWTALYGMNYHLASQGVDYQNANGPVSPLEHFWSLAVEEQFYLIWPIVIMLFAVTHWKYRWKAFGVFLLGIGAVSFAFSVNATHTNTPYAYFSLQSRAWELCIGAAVYLFASRAKAIPAYLARGLSWAGLGMIIVCTSLYTDSTLFPGVAALLPVLGTALVITAGCRLGGSGAERILALRPMQFVGRLSYGWYLWHWPLLVLVPILTAQDFSWQLNLEVLVLALWCAMLMMHLIEKPSQRWKFSRSAWLTQGAVMISSAVAVSLLVVATLPSLVGSGTAGATIKLDASGTNVLQADLAKGLSLKTAPKNLTPSLDDVRNDQPKSTADGCHAGFLQVDQGSCVYGDPAGTRTMVLFGDSHAQQWLPALNKQAIAQHWKLVSWTKAACPVAQVRIVTESLKRQYTECYRWRDKAIKRIVKLNPDQIIVSQSDLVPGDQVTDQQWADLTVRTVRLLAAGGASVSYLLDTPLPGTDVPACIAEHLGNVQKCNRSRVDAYGTGSTRHMDMATTLKAAGVRTIEPIDNFCTATACPMIVGNVLVYRDPTHMSTTYSEVLAPLTKPLFTNRVG
ncbi:hypothetical protein BH09ACT10_BH09ACT10_01210 [soil metagenome]